MRIGIIGLGARIASIAKDFAAAEPSARFVAVADPTDIRMASLTALGAEPMLYGDPATMLAEHRFDLVMIGSPNHLHLDHLRLVLQGDTPHIFCEKPVVTTRDDTIELARLIAAHDGERRVMIGLVLRYSPLYRALRQAQAEGRIGEVMSIEASEHIAPYHGSFFMRDWRRDSALSGGFMLEKCCHDIDLYQGVVGARPVRVASFGGRSRNTLPERSPVRRSGPICAHHAPALERINLRCLFRPMATSSTTRPRSSITRTRAYHARIFTTPEPQRARQTYTAVLLPSAPRHRPKAISCATASS